MSNKVVGTVKGTRALKKGGGTGAAGGKAASLPPKARAGHALMGSDQSLSPDTRGSNTHPTGTYGGMTEGNPSRYQQSNTPLPKAPQAGHGVQAAGQSLAPATRGRK